MRVLIMAGGTGGHIFPALAVAKRLVQQGHTVHWLGTKQGMEARIVTENSIPIHFIRISGLRGKGLATKLLAPFKLSLALIQSLWVLLNFKPDLVLGLGGYVTGPGGIAAWILRKKLVIHEQNAVAGMTNQLLARFSYRVLEAFPNSFAKSVGAQITGNPVREEFHKLLPPEKRIIKNNGAALKILILGGSGGAQALNNIMPNILNSWSLPTKPVIWHQAGAKNLANAKLVYEQLGFTENSKNLKLVDFIQDMPNAYAWADVVIARAGALTVAELAAAGVASILIPYPYAVDDHQTKNAQYLVTQGAAVLLQEKELSQEKLLSLLQSFAAEPDKLQSMAKAAYRVAQPEALDKVVGFCLQD